MLEFWDRQIRRADQLASQASGSKELLSFYAQLLRAQKQIHENLCRRLDQQPIGDIRTDLPAIHSLMNGVLEIAVLHGPTTLAEEAKTLLKSEPAVIDEMLIDYWDNRSDIEFFPKAILQPYLRVMIESGVRPISRLLPPRERTCPYCGGNPQVSYLQNNETTAESGNRDLLCATCLASWEFRRVVCANCGEERPTKLGYFHSEEFDHIRIEACDSCKHYIKGVDLTRLGHAAPLVDDVYAAPLDLWAREHGYTKIELNLVGV